MKNLDQIKQQFFAYIPNQDLEPIREDLNNLRDILWSHKDDYPVWIHIRWESEKIGHEHHLNLPVEVIILHGRDLRDQDVDGQWLKYANELSVNRGLLFRKVQ